MNSSIIFDNILSLIHKKCHPESYQSDIKYHMTLHIIFSMLITPYCDPYTKATHVDSSLKLSKF